MLERYEGKLSRTVLRGLEAGNGLRLLDSGTAAIPPCDAQEWERKGCTLDIAATYTFFPASGGGPHPARRLPIMGRSWVIECVLANLL